MLYGSPTDLRSDDAINRNVNQYGNFVFLSGFPRWGAAVSACQPPTDGDGASIPVG